MPSLLHEVLLELFRNLPALAPQLLRDALHAELPPHSVACIDSENLTQVQPTEYRADLVVRLEQAQASTVMGIIVEVQLAPDPAKMFAWPVYAATLRARLKRPALLMVVAADESTARWARQDIDLGGGNRFTPLVVSPALVPVITDESLAEADPELAILSVLAHGQHPDFALAARIAAAAQHASRDLDLDRATLYYDLTLKALSEGARRALKDMAIAGYQYQSDFARHYFAQGRNQGKAEGNAEGKAEGKAEVLARLLERRFGLLPEDVHDRLAACSMDELDAITERLLTAASLHDVLGSR